MAGRGLDSAARVLRGPTIDQERHRSCALDDHQEPPHRGETRRTDDPGRCPGVPSLLASDTKCRQKTESLFAKAFKSLLQQNLPSGAGTTARPQNVCRLNVGPVEHSLKSQGRAVDITSRGDNTHGPSNRVAGKLRLALAVHTHTLVPTQNSERQEILEFFGFRVLSRDR